MESGRENRLDDPTPTVSNGGNADRSVSPDPCASEAEPPRKDDIMNLSNGCLFLRSHLNTKSIMPSHSLVVFGLIAVLTGPAAAQDFDSLREKLDSLQFYNDVRLADSEFMRKSASRADSGAQAALAGLAETAAAIRRWLGTIRPDALRYREGIVGSEGQDEGWFMRERLKELARA